MANWRDMPAEVSKQRVLKTLGDSKDYRNPLRLQEMGKTWPDSERNRDYGKALSTATEWSKKGRPI